MELLTDVAFLSRLQFTLIVAFHFVFVPMSIGVGLITAIFQTKACRSNDEKDANAAWFWVKCFTATFVVGVATGITMEFSFGTNWADYSRFVGDIFGAPLAAEALFAFFLESVFLGVLLFGRGKVSPKFYTVAAWLVWAGSCLSALWILIANSWMQTPAGGALAADGSKAVLTDFFAAAFNPSTGNRYFHTVTAALAMGGLVAMAIGAYYYIKGKYSDFARKSIVTGLIIAAIGTGALFVSAHSTAVGVWNTQPTKLAAMEGQYSDEVPNMYLFGWVDEQSEEVIGPMLPGFTSFLAEGNFDTEYPGLNTLAETEQYGDLDVDSLPVNAIFQTYHFMVAVSGVILLLLVLVFIAWRTKRFEKWRWLQWVVFIAPAVALLAIECGWFTAELGRQPWVVYPAVGSPEGLELLTDVAYSHSVSAWEMWVTIILFCAIYLLLFVAWIRIIAKFVKAGPVPAVAEGDDNEFLFEEEIVATGKGEVAAVQAGAVIETDENVAKEGE